MNPRGKRRLVVSFLFLIFLGLLLFHAARPAPAAKGWLLVFQPDFTNRASADGQHRALTFVVSNTSPHDLDFSINWFECRTRSDLTLVSVKSPRANALGKKVSLPSRAVTNVLIELAAETDAQLLFCCQLNWLERESRLRGWIRKVDEPMYWVAAYCDFNWNPPWRNAAFACGDTFASNLDPAEYFRRVYGFTRERWLEERRLEQKRQAEQDEALARTRSETRSGGFMMRLGNPEPAPEEQIALDAKGAFASLCRASTNGSTAEPGRAAPSPGPRTGSP